MIQNHLTKGITVPHCIIEYAKEFESDIAPSAFIKAVHQGAVASTLFDESHIKTRTHAVEHYQVGTDDSRFIHITAHILSGRSVEQKAQLSAHILSQLQALALTAVVITVQICDIERDTYTKVVL